MREEGGRERRAGCLSAAALCFPPSHFHVLLTGGPFEETQDGDDNGALWVAFGVFKHSLLCAINNLRQQQSFLPEPCIIHGLCAAGGAQQAEHLLLRRREAK